MIVVVISMAIIITSIVIMIVTRMTTVMRATNLQYDFETMSLIRAIG